MVNLSNYRAVVDVSNRIYLKILEKEHATSEYRDWLNDSAVNKYLETRSSSVRELEEYIADKLNGENSLLFGIFNKSNNKHIGNIKLEPINFEKSCATIGIIIGDKNYWGRGLATEATRVLVNYAFNELGLKEINLGVISENEPAMRVYEKCGFEKYKIEEKSIKHGDMSFDRIYMRKINTKI